MEQLIKESKEERENEKAERAEIQKFMEKPEVA
jgi:hypothetical protein